MQEIDISETSPAGPEAVFRLLGDSRSWPRWTPIETAEIVEAGGADGTGEIRVFKTGRVTVREEIVERTPDKRLSYVLHSGLAVRDYPAEVELEAAGGGTRIRWHTTFAPKLPGTGGLYRRALEKVTRQFA